MIPLSVLAELAAKATPGPWEVNAHRNVASRHVAPPGSYQTVASNLLYEDAAFIAACSPDVVAALVRAVQAGTENYPGAIEDFHAALEPFRETP